MNSSLPLLSCICFTENQPIILQRALACFEKQDYPNKEIVICYPKNDLLTKNLIDEVALISDIDLLRIELNTEDDHQTAKNNAVTATRGEYICIWDDHSWHHKGRLSDQYQAISSGNYKASILKRILFFNYHDKKTYSSPFYHWEETLLCEKEILLRQITNKHQWEVFWVFDELIPLLALYEINDKAHLIVHVCHESNTNPEDVISIQSWPEANHLNQNITELTDLQYYLL